MKRSCTEKSIKSSSKLDYVKMIKGLVSPNKLKNQDNKHKQTSQDSSNSKRSHQKSVKSKLKKAKDIEAFNRKISSKIEQELKDYVKEFRKKVSVVILTLSRSSRSFRSQI